MNARESEQRRGHDGLLMLLLFGCLILARLAILGPAYQNLISGEGGIDLEARRGELEFAIHRVDPALAALALDRERWTERFGSWHRARAVDGRLDVPSLEEIAVGRFADGEFLRANALLAAYPQWTYPMLLPFLWPPFEVLPWFYAGLLTLGFVAVCWLASRRYLGQWRWLAILVCLVPMSAWAASVSTGQLSIPITVGIFGYAWAIDQRRWWLAGVLLGLLSVKPTSTALMVVLLLPPLLTGGARLVEVGRSVLVASVMIVGSSLLMWWWVGTDPLTAFQALMTHNVGAADKGYGLMPEITRRLGEIEFSARTAMVTRWFTTLGVFAALGAAVGLRRHGTLVQLAIVGLISRLWAYHHHYDDVLLIFLLLALFALARRGSLLCAGALACVALTLATPTPTSEAYALWRNAVWVLGALVLVVEARNTHAELRV